MQQRQLRLGDILDDYCPRERRITNHAVVAMIGDEVKQTRCTTCDSDHEYRQARVPPPRRKKDALTPPQWADQGTKKKGSVKDTSFVPGAPAAAAPADAQPDSIQAAGSGPAGEAGSAQRQEDGAQRDEDSEPGDEDIEQREDDGPVHRRLIRATLPRPEGKSPERKIPEFTVRHPGGNQRQGRGRRGARGPQGPSFSGPMRFGSGSHQNSSQGRQRQNGNNRPGPSSGSQRDGSRPQGQRRGCGSGRKRGR